MMAEIIEFKPKEAKPLLCAFCKKPLKKGTKTLSSSDGTKHICAVCLVECYALIGEA